ncbi:MAG: hypothetical protein AB1710_08845 [Pseudomonadota bacterium]
MVKHFPDYSFSAGRPAVRAEILTIRNLILRCLRPGASAMACNLLREHSALFQNSAGRQAQWFLAPC